MDSRIHVAPLKNVSTCKEPLIFRKHITWDVIQWNVSQWRNLFSSGSNTTPKTFRKGRFVCSKEPLWERKCSSVLTGMDEFFDKFSSESSNADEWLYFDYKHIADHLTPDMASKLNFTWEAVGFPDKSARDSTLWIGTVGSHTPCHVDTYGCNFVAQINGKKRWLLFPPSETCNLKPTRVPYEESSVYSSFNFFRGCGPFPDVNDVRLVDLEPGDVLYIPNGWWHYVENLTSAISVNIWIPLVLYCDESDDFNRLKEGLVKYLIRSTLYDSDPALNSQILNPNEDDLRTIPRGQIVSELQWCLNRVQPDGELSKASRSNPEPDHLSDKHTLPRTSISDVRSQLNSPHDCKIASDSTHTSSVELNLLKAFSHPDVIKLALEKFIELNAQSSFK